MGMDDQVERALPQEAHLLGEGSSALDMGEVEPSRVPTPTLRFLVEGRAVPKGSKSIYQGRPVESSKDYPAWAEAVGMTALVAKKRHRIALFTGPVTVHVGFWLPRPKKPADPKHHITKPDLDKLIRGVLDPLTGVVWTDDAQVDTILATKHYVDEKPYVYIQIGETP